MRRLVTAGLAFAMVLMAGRSASADATGFLGANTTPENRATRGFAVGAGLLLIAFEFEYAHTLDDRNALAPSLTTGSGNLLLQSPFSIFGFQPYVTAGGGLYRETLALRGQTGFAVNSGAGVKVSLAGPLRLRVDYRVFKLGEGALYSPAHRVYVGLNLKF